jgi:hypothetical protein
MLLKLKNLQYAKKQTLCLCVTGVSLNRTEQILKKKKCKLSNQNNLDTHFSMEEIREDV